MDIRGNEIKSNINNSISILNKIKHKQLLIDSIFSFAEKRPMIFPYLIGNDQLLKKNLKHTIEPMKKKNTLLDSFNDNIYKFIAYRLLLEINSEIVLQKIKEMLIKNYIDSGIYFSKNTLAKDNLGIFDELNSRPQSALDYFYKELIEVFKKNKLPSNLNIDFSTILDHIPKKKNFVSFIKDYLSIQKEVILFFLPLTFLKVKEDEYNNFKWVREKMYEDSYYLKNIDSKNKLNQKIDLICLINKDNFYDELMIVEYNNINKLYFIFDDNDDEKNLFEIIYKYLINIKHKENLEEIIFNDNFQEEGITYNNFYKTYLSILIDDYYKMLKNIGEINLNLISLKTIEFNDEIIENNVLRFKIRYHLNKIFGFNAWCNLSIIKYKEIENFDNNKDERVKVKQKAYIFNNKTTNLKVLLIDLEHNSPYQTTFYNFCKECLDNNPYINLIVFHNIGNNHYDEEFYKNIKNNPKIIIPNLSQILYENTEEKIEENIPTNCNSFFNSFFDCSKFMLYEGYDNNNNLIYFNMSLEKLQEHELNRIFLNENKIYLINCKYENIQIKYKRNDNHLIIKNNNKMFEQYVYYKPFKFFSSLIENLKLKKLTFNGFNYKISEVNNPKINILNINSLNSFSVNNCVRKINELDSNDNFEKFINLKYLIISGCLGELSKYTAIKNLEKIKFYAKEYNESIVKNIEKKCKKRKIILEIIDSKKNNKYENEEEAEKEYYDKEDNDEKNIIVNKPKKRKKIISYNNLNSDILE